MSDPKFMAEVTQPVLIKDGAVFLACKADGSVTVDCALGFGLFYRDTRYLSRYEFRIGGERCLTLMSSSARGVEAIHELANDTARQTDGAKLELQMVGARLERKVDGAQLTLTDTLSLRNYSLAPMKVRVELLFDALFEDIFELRGAPSGKRGPLRVVTKQERALTFRYAGADRVERSLAIAFSSDPTFSRCRQARIAAFDIELKTQETAALVTTLTIEECPRPVQAAAPLPTFYHAAELKSDDPRLDRIVARSFDDLRMLRTELETNFIAGGLPWFVSPFGRDSLIAAIQGMPFDTRPAEGVARLFARLQGRRRDPETGEASGKIPHELRVGAMARLAEIPQRPSYMSVDSTPLFLILVAEHALWTGGFDLFDELRRNIERALFWILSGMESHAQGYLAYSGQTPEGPVNQGWKDSVFGVPRRDGRPPLVPIALCEVQGYVYRALTAVAKVSRASGEVAVADRLDADAKALKARFDRDFWMNDEGCYALALERGGRQVTTVTSNAGQVLWSGIATDSHAVETARRLMRPDMLSGWGIRTLSSEEIAYNPLNYHLGSVWPFDNALIVAGLKRYGLDDEAVRVCDQVLDAGDCFALGRLPEFYVGHSRERGLFPARCPFAEPLQAWSAGAAPYMLTSLLGLRREGAEIILERPLLPASVSRLSLRGIIGGDRVLDVEVRRDRSGRVAGDIRERSEEKS